MIPEQILIKLEILQNFGFTTGVEESERTIEVSFAITGKYSRTLIISKGEYEEATTALVLSGLERRINFETEKQIKDLL